MTSLKFPCFLHGFPFDGFAAPFHLCLKAAMDGFSPSVQTECTSLGCQDPKMWRRWESKGLPTSFWRVQICWYVFLRCQSSRIRSMHERNTLTLPRIRWLNKHQRSQHAPLRPTIHRVFEISPKPWGKHRRGWQKKAMVHWKIEWCWEMCLQYLQLHV